MVPKSKSKEYGELSSSHPVPPSAWGSPHPKQATTAMNICVPFQSLYTYTQANMHYYLLSSLLNKIQHYIYTHTSTVSHLASPS